MKNWIIILTIFIVPMAIYGFLSHSTTADAFMEKLAANKPVEQNKEIENVKQTQYKCPLPTVYKFCSPLCKDCQLQTKEMEGLDKEFEGKVTFQTISVTGAQGENKEIQGLVKKYNVKVVPTLVIVDCEGKMVKKYEYVVKKKDLQKVLENVTMSEAK